MVGFPPFKVMMMVMVVVVVLLGQKDYFVRAANLGRLTQFNPSHAMRPAITIHLLSESTLNPPNE